MGFDSGFGNGFSFDVGSGLSRADAYSVRMRFHSPWIRGHAGTLLYNIVTQSANVSGDFTLARCHVRGR